MNMVKDNRKDNREPHEANLEFSIEGEPIKTFRAGVSIDMSESGIGIISDCALEPGQVIIFKGKETPPVIKIAIVQWTMKSSEKYRAGLMFI